MSRVLLLSLHHALRSCNGLDAPAAWLQVKLMGGLDILVNNGEPHEQHAACVCGHDAALRHPVQGCSLSVSLWALLVQPA